MVNLMRKVEIAIEECGIEVPITRRDIDDLLMIMKHCVYRARFRENVVRFFLKWSNPRPPPGRHSETGPARGRGGVPTIRMVL